MPELYTLPPIQLELEPEARITKQQTQHLMHPRRHTMSAAKRETSRRRSGIEQAAAEMATRRKGSSLLPPPSNGRAQQPRGTIGHRHGAMADLTIPLDQELEDRPNLPLAKIVPSKLNPRQTYDETKLAELTESVRIHGVLVAVIVRPLDGKPGFYELVAGHRRFRASQLAEHTAIRAEVRQLTDAQALEIMTIENLQREDIHPLEEADGFRTLMALSGADGREPMTAEQLAARIGKSPAYVYGALKLLNLPDEAQRAFRSGRLSKNHCILIGRIPNAKLREKATARILSPTEWRYQHDITMRGEVLSFRAAKEAIEKEFMKELKGSPFDQADAKLLPEAGACAACPKRTGNNRMEYPEGRADVCTDPACFTKKAQLTVQLSAEKLTKKGLEVLGKNEARRHFYTGCNGGQVRKEYGSPYVERNDRVPHDPKGRTYRELLGDDAEADTKVLLDAKNRPHYVLDKDRAAELAAAKGVATTKAQGRQRQGEDWQVREQRKELMRRAVLSHIHQEITNRLARVVGLSAAPVADVLKFALVEQLEDNASKCSALTQCLGLDVPSDVAGRQNAVDLFDQFLARPASDQLALLLTSVISQAFDWDLDLAHKKQVVAAFKLDLRAISQQAKAKLKALTSGKAAGSDEEAE